MNEVFPRQLTLSPILGNTLIGIFEIWEDVMVGKLYSRKTPSSLLKHFFQSEVDHERALC